MYVSHLPRGVSVERLRDFFAHGLREEIGRIQPRSGSAIVNYLSPKGRNTAISQFTGTFFGDQRIICKAAREDRVERQVDYRSHHLLSSGMAEMNLLVNSVARGAGLVCRLGRQTLLIHTALGDLLWNATKLAKSVYLVIADRRLQHFVAYARVSSVAAQESSVKLTESTTTAPRGRIILLGGPDHNCWEPIYAPFYELIVDVLAVNSVPFSQLMSSRNLLGNDQPISMGIDGTPIDNENGRKLLERMLYIESKRD